MFENETVELEEEEEEIPITEDEPLDIKLLMQEMECMKRRIQMMQLRLKLSIDECPEEECLDYEVLLNCSENKEICAVQKAQNILQFQINELNKCCKIAKKEIQDLHERVCERNQEIMKLKELVKILMEWKNTLEHEFGKCLERFEYLKHVKVEWRDLNDKLEEQTKLYDSLKETFIPKMRFIQEKKLFICAINEIKEMLKELYQYQFERFANLEKRLQKREE
ncbi:uncharacterized protein ACRADG_010508 [Cochliomyia hominivorax]